MAGTRQEWRDGRRPQQAARLRFVPSAGRLTLRSAVVSCAVAFPDFQTAKRYRPCCCDGAGAPEVLMRLALARLGLAPFALRPMRARGTPDARAHPQPRVQSVKSTRASSPRSRRRHPAFRTQWLERLASRKPPVTDPSVITAGEDFRAAALPLYEERTLALPHGARRCAGITRFGPSANGAVVTTIGAQAFPASRELSRASRRSDTDRGHRIPPRVS